MNTENTSLTDDNGPAYLYLMQDVEGTHVKIGFSTNVQRRIRDLWDAVDYPQSWKVRFPTLRMARRAETFLHTFLEDYKAPKAHRREGFQEWFRIDAMKVALGFLRREQTFLRCSEPEPLTPADKPLPVAVDFASLKAARLAEEAAGRTSRNDDTARKLTTALHAALASGTLRGRHGEHLIFTHVDPVLEDCRFHSANYSRNIFPVVLTIDGAFWVLEKFTAPDPITGHPSLADAFAATPALADLRHLLDNIPPLVREARA